MLNQILLGDCYELMKGIPDGSIDLVLTDPPYNTTSCDWDQTEIDLIEFWKHIKRVLKPLGAVVSTAAQPFTTDLINSNRKWFKYDLTWDKHSTTGFLNAKKMPLRRHEDILVFCAGKTTYNPQMVKGVLRAKGTGNTSSPVYGEHKVVNTFNDTYYPTSIVDFYNGQQSEKLHPTQKTVSLFEYLIRTFSNPDETILDPFAGSGTTAIAALNTGRNFICFEKESKYWQSANKRLALAQMQGRFEEMVG